MLIELETIRTLCELDPFIHALYSVVKKLWDVKFKNDEPKLCCEVGPPHMKSRIKALVLLEPPLETGLRRMNKKLKK